MKPFNFLKNFCKSLLIIIAIVFISNNSFAGNNKGALRIRAFIEFDQQPIEYAQIDIYVDSKKIDSFSTNLKGEFKLFLDLDKNYIINISKPGFVSKKIEISTSIPKNESGIWQYDFFVDLFKHVPGLDLTPLNKPITIIKYDSRSGMFEHDVEYTLAMKAEVNSVLQQQIALRKLASKN